MEKIVKTPLNDKDVLGLRAGDSVLLTGYIYTARDAAHKRLVDLLDKGEKLPFDVKGQVIYYVGPTPAKPGDPIGSAGPTSSYRMDPYAPRLLDIGLKGMIGKGLRNEEVINSIKKNCAVYFASIGGAAALTAKCVKSAELIAYEDLGSEAVRKLYVENLPLIVVIDSKGNNFYKEGQEKYLKSLNK
ncbi:MAG TPA: Fe-S-containing hydro-lyase [Clostridiaceae bacterium]|jgi:fumarate hydratase subunit beta|nr:Fe-S-containing hydro-lyase [Clostridiaceae bacterium]HBF78202.1 Fe-S-containing hydro-lyase [Clostridiaceae bacterium]HBG37759.1 Fe-S-containing hydro-lyase [Clostridiaceae bacterium]HBN27983.1 Fe-S-containing hydro-lyase [Clostridiaceae bacterium]HBX48208.1 Fe-S-containing hydro-lyase [Clostridiaceae bacterium]